MTKKVKKCFHLFLSRIKWSVYFSCEIWTITCTLQKKSDRKLDFFDVINSMESAKAVNFWDFFNYYTKSYSKYPSFSRNPMDTIILYRKYGKYSQKCTALALSIELITSKKLSFRSDFFCKVQVIVHISQEKYTEHLIRSRNKWKHLFTFFVIKNYRFL